VAAQFENPFGLAGPPTGYALARARHMHEFGTTSEQLAELAVATRKWAQLNPRAIMRDPLTVADVLVVAHDLLAAPLLDCCLVTDAGGAVVVTSAERARDCRRSRVYVLGTGEASTHVMVSQMPDFARWDAAGWPASARSRWRA
jgi:acetyl-CoA acetyltransferase